MNKSRFLLAMVVFVLLALILFPATAQEMMGPAVEVADQVVTDGWVTVDYVYSEGPGFIVIHVYDAAYDTFGGVLGYRWVNPGANYNIKVKLDPSMIEPTPKLYAMLHKDDGTVGTYEFGGGSGLDGPVMVDGAPLAPAFMVNAISAHDQFLDGNTVTISGVWVPQDSWMVIHRHDETRNSFGGVLGQTFVPAGVTTDVVVELSGDITPSLWPMLHVDDGALGTYEFDGRSGLDNPVVVGGKVAVMRIWTVPHVRASDQIVIYGDGMEMEMMGAPTVTIASVLSEGPGVLVVHKHDPARNSFGPVAGFAFVNAGYNANVVVELDPAEVTTILWPMLHVDDGTVGAYEFDGSSGLDNPIVVDGQVVAVSINAAPSINYTGTLADNVLTIPNLIIDAPGFLAIHADNGSGRPGPVVGNAPLLRGMNYNVSVTLGDGATEALFPMLHYDTSTDGPPNGIYEFDGANGLDRPVFVGGQVVVGPFSAGE